MSFSHVGNVGTANSKATVGSDQDVTLALSPSQDIDVGQLVVVWLACDSVHNAGAPSHPTLNERLKCSDSVGNLYTTLVASTDGGINNFAMGGIFIARVGTAITTTDTITTRMRAVTGGGARAMSVHVFDYDDSKRWGIADPGGQRVTSRAIDPPSLSTGTILSTREHLIVHLLAAEGPNTDAYTWDSDYTQISGDGTTGGAADSNIHVRGGFRIVSGITSDTVDVTSTTADRDYTQGIACVVEVPWDSTFPRTPLLSDFTGADEEPLSEGGNWVSTLCSAGVASGTPRFLRRVGNRAAGSTATGQGGSWWAEVFAGGEGEVWVTTAVKGGCAIAYNGTGCANAATVDGLGARWMPSAGGTNAGDSIQVGSVGNVGGTDNERFRSHVTMGDGFKIGVRRKAPDLHLWIDRGSGWEWVAAIAATGLLAGFNSGGKLSIQSYLAACRLDDFGGGIVTANRHLLPILHVGP